MSFDAITPAVDPPAPAADVSALQIDDLVKRYATGTEALRGVSLGIEAGEFFGLLGPKAARLSSRRQRGGGFGRARPRGGSGRML